ncbi:hypothetical protein J2T17_004405 [Paenibacillus mucilaginosus]|uniref:replication-relaxation family protein n=1 Tax=Paenibacillus mucilaginosus TaxID=61624 RepID=UPI003D1C86FB
MQQGNLTSFEDIRESESAAKETTSFPLLSPVVAEHLNPYTDSVCPSDIHQLLLPDGKRFGLFSDPYATVEYHQPKFGMPNGKYWLETNVNGGEISERELKLIDVLSTNRTMTRRQLERIIFPGMNPQDRAGVEFIKKCRSRGIICAYRWNTPLKDERTKPMAYTLTRYGAEAAEILFRRKVSKDFWSSPVAYTSGQGAKMDLNFVDLASNELYAELVRVDRLVKWERQPAIRADQSTYHYPVAAFEVIRDRGDFLKFWVEVFRPQTDYIQKTAQRFARIRQVYTKLPEHNRPARVLLITDGEARIPLLARLAEQYMPEVPLRFTSDERLLAGIAADTFLEYNVASKKILASTMRFLAEDAPGMRASEFFAETRGSDYDDEFED